MCGGARRLHRARTGRQGLDGGSVAPGVPHLAAQDERYLLGALKAYKEGKRTHAALKVIADRMSEAEVRNVAAYYAGLPAAGLAPAKDVSHVSPYERGKTRATDCTKCHGADGNGTAPGIPSLAEQDYKYLVEAIRAYRTMRKREKMRLYITGLKDKEIQDIAAYYATQKSGPAERGQTMVRDLTEKCDRCHAARTGSAGSAAMAVPKLAGQDRDYLMMALRAYRDDRRESTTMHKMSLPYGDAVIESIASYYASQPGEITVKIKALAKVPPFLPRAAAAGPPPQA